MGSLEAPEPQARGRNATQGPGRFLPCPRTPQAVVRKHNTRLSFGRPQLSKSLGSATQCFGIWTWAPRTAALSALSPAPSSWPPWIKSLRITKSGP